MGQTKHYGHINDATFLGRGMNMGNYLEAAGRWKRSEKREIRRDDFRIIKEAGFETIRLPVCWSSHTGKNPPFGIDSYFLDQVRETTGWALQAGLKVVLNVHHYTEMMKCTPDEIGRHAARLEAIWDRICRSFTAADYPSDRMVFELLNEPNGTITCDEWNRMLPALVDVVWKRNGELQSGRKIMIGTAEWGGIPGLFRLRLPAQCDRGNTIVTVHFYEPFRFTHQGAEWVEDSKAWTGTRWTGTPAERRAVLDLLESVTAWNGEAGRGYEIFLGEFGAYSKHAADYDRAAWTGFVAREAERLGMSWAYWEYSHGFGAYDLSQNAWRPGLIAALIPA